MSATRKPRGDAKLKTLPEDRQAQIDDLLAGHTLKEVQTELAADGLHVSLEALSQFYSWRQLRSQFARKESLVNEILDQLRQDDPEISEDALFKHGQTVFGLLALEEKSAKDWKRVQDVRIKNQVLDLERQKFQRETAELFLKWHADKRAVEIAGRAGIETNEKMELLEQLMFGDMAPAADAAEKISPK